MVADGVTNIIDGMTTVDAIVDTGKGSHIRRDGCQVVAVRWWKFFCKVLRRTGS